MEGQVAMSIECDCFAESGVPGTLFPAEILGTEGIKESKDGKIIVMRCDTCSLFPDDVAAARFLSALTGAKMDRWYDNTDEPYFHVYLVMSLERALATRVSAKDDKGIDTSKMPEELLETCPEGLVESCPEQPICHCGGEPNWKSGWCGKCDGRTITSAEDRPL